MLVSLLLDLHPSCNPSRWSPAALRAVAYALFGAGNPAVATALHATTGDKPFTVARLQQDNPAALRLTALTEMSAQALLAGAAAAVGKSLRMEDIVLKVDRVVTEGSPLVGTTKYNDLARSSFSPYAPLQFATPTAFSQGGDLHLPLPVPELLLRSWWRRWNAFCDPDLIIGEETVAGLVRQVGLARAQIETVTVDLGRGKMVGFTGPVTLEALRHKNWSDEERSAFATLVSYSRFCGTGVRTPLGMGLTLPG